MLETQLDFDALDASGGQAAVAPLNLKTCDKNLHIPEMSAMMREWSMLRRCLPQSFRPPRPCGREAVRRRSPPQLVALRCDPAFSGRKDTAWNRAKRKGG